MASTCVAYSSRRFEQGIGYVAVACDRWYWAGFDIGQAD